MSRYFSMIFLFCFISPLTAECQNRFSQFYASPLLVNPANTGRFNKSYRIGGEIDKAAYNFDNQPMLPALPAIDLIIFFHCFLALCFELFLLFIG